MSFIKFTEADSPYRNIEEMPVSGILESLNREDATIALAVKEALPAIEKLVTVVADQLLAGGRLFYIGAGTSGRLAVVDASECPPTFGVPDNLVNGIIAGGEKAFTRAVEFAEDSTDAGWADLMANQINSQDVVIGVSASGTAPYVLHALLKCREAGISTGAICNNPGSPIAAIAAFPVEINTGPEFITGSTRLKAGTAQKMVLNMISTAVMIQLGRVEDNHMVHMQLSNEKLIERGAKMVMKKLKMSDLAEARSLLLQHGSVSKAIDSRQS